MYNGMENNDIISKILLGDQQCFGELVKRYQNLVFTIALHYTQNREDAEEIAQDIFVKAYRALADFKGNSKFSTWLYTIATNTAITHLRKKKPQIYLINNEKNLEQLNATNNDYSANRAEQKSKIEILNKAILLLKPDDAQVIILFYKGEQSIEEIGQITGLTPNAVKVKLHRARQRLKETLKTYFAGELKEMIN